MVSVQDWACVSVTCIFINKITVHIFSSNCLGLGLFLFAGLFGQSWWTTQGLAHASSTFATADLFLFLFKFLLLLFKKKGKKRLCCIHGSGNKCTFHLKTGTPRFWRWTIKSVSPSLVLLGEPWLSLTSQVVLQMLILLNLSSLPPPVISDGGNVWLTTL